MLGLRLDEPLSLAGLEDAVDGEALDRLEALGLAARGRREHAEPDSARAVPRRRRDGRAAGLKCLHT